MSKSKNEKLRAQLAQEYDVPASILQGETEEQMRDSVEALKAEMPHLMRSQRERDLIYGAAAMALRESTRSKGVSIPMYQKAVDEL